MTESIDKELENFKNEIELDNIKVDAKTASNWLRTLIVTRVTSLAFLACAIISAMSADISTFDENLEATYWLITIIWLSLSLCTWIVSSSQKILHREYLKKTVMNYMVLTNKSGDQKPDNDVALKLGFDVGTYKTNVELVMALNSIYRAKPYLAFKRVKNALT